MHEAFTLAFVDYRFTGAFSLRRTKKIEVPPPKDGPAQFSKHSTFYNQDEFARVMTAAQVPPWNV